MLLCYLSYSEGARYLEVAYLRAVSKNSYFNCQREESLMFIIILMCGVVFVLAVWFMGEYDGRRESFIVLSGWFAPVYAAARSIIGWVLPEIVPAIVSLAAIFGGYLVGWLLLGDWMGIVCLLILPSILMAVFLGYVVTVMYDSGLFPETPIFFRLGLLSRISGLYGSVVETLFCRISSLAPPSIPAHVWIFVTWPLWVTILELGVFLFGVIYAIEVAILLCIGLANGVVFLAANRHLTVVVGAVIGAATGMLVYRFGGVSEYVAILVAGVTT